MRSRAVVTLLSLFLAAPGAALAQSEPAPGGSFKVGVVLRRFVPPEPYEWRGAATHALLAAVWYPADPRAQARSQLFGPPNGPAIFEAGPAAADAEIAQSPARFPLILLSHGTGGTAQSMAWFATALASHGYFVAAVNHPGNTALEAYTVQGFMLWWKRAQDISVVLDALLADATLGAHIDPQRIGGAGFSLGGYTTIELAGGITSLAQFGAFCKEPGNEERCKAPPEFSDSVAKSQALARSDAGYAAALKESGKSYREPRIRAVFAMAPALAPAFTPESLQAIAIPVAIVAGESDSILPIDVHAKRFAATIPHAKLTIFPGRVDHYAFLDECSPAGREAMASICVDAAGVDRAAIHRETVALATKFFDDRLK